MPPNEASGKADFVIQEIAGCGPFQAILTFLVYFLAKMSVVFSIHFLIFCNYNPGWRCLDDNSINRNSSTLQGNNAQQLPNLQEQNNSLIESELGKDNEAEFTFNNCSLFQSCRNIQFDSTITTVVSEWGLLCDKAWIGSFIISLQMLGILVGSFVIGHLGDAIGRRTTIYGALVAVAILNLVSVFSTSWQMLAVVRFFLGVACSGNLSIVYVYVAEFVTLKWRVRVVSIPYWPTTAIIFGLTLMALKNWRHILIVTIGLSVVGFLPAVWMPESLRWLEVKHKTRQFLQVARKITRVNGKILPPKEELLAGNYSGNSHSATREQKQKHFVLLHLFKKGYKLQSVIVGYEWLACSICHYTLNFGIRTLYGNIFVNMIVISFIEIPSNFIAMGISKFFGRKSSKLVCLAFIVACFLTAGFFSLSSWTVLKTTGVFVVVMVTKACFAAYWCFLYSHTAELYPTVVRSLAINWGSLFARVGGTIAPFLVPSDPESNYISYAAMAGLGIVSSLVLLTLMETKGKPLKETFDDGDALGDGGGDGDEGGGGGDEGGGGGGGEIHGDDIGVGVLY